MLVGCTVHVEAEPTTLLETTTTVAEITTTTAKPPTTTTTVVRTTTTQPEGFDDWTVEELALHVKSVDPSMFSGLSTDDLIESADNFCAVMNEFNGDMTSIMEGFQEAWSADPGSLTAEELGGFLAASIFIATYGDLCPRWKAIMLDFMENSDGA